MAMPGTRPSPILSLLHKRAPTITLLKAPRPCFAEPDETTAANRRSNAGYIGNRSGSPAQVHRLLVHAARLWRDLKNVSAPTGAGPLFWVGLF